MEIPDEAARLLIGPRADYYLGRWRRWDERAPLLGFNWPALLAGACWMLYRRMYRAFCILVGALALEGLAEAALLGAFGIEELPRAVDLLINLLVAVTCGNLACYWYYLELRRHYRRLLAAGEPSPAALQAAGGVSWLALSAGILVTAALLALMLALDC